MATRLRWWRRRATRQQWGEDLRAGSGGGRQGVKFGCSTTTAGSFPADGLVGLSGDAVSLVTQLGGEASLGRRFSYSLVPHSVNSSSAFNFGTLANVTELGAASTPLVAGDVDTYYTVVLDFVRVGNKTVASAASSRIIVDSGNAKISFVTPANCKKQTEQASPDLTLEFGGGGGRAAVALKPENASVTV
nr:aspartic proteinase CDR1-like [Oryza sativa Japonica Group]